MFLVVFCSYKRKHWKKHVYFSNHLGIIIAPLFGVPGVIVQLSKEALPNPLCIFVNIGILIAPLFDVSGGILQLYQGASGNPICMFANILRFLLHLFLMFLVPYCRYNRKQQQIPCLCVYKHLGLLNALLFDVSGCTWQFYKGTAGNPIGISLNTLGFSLRR